MAERFHGWIPILHFAQGEYHRIRGDLSNALEMLQKALNHTSPGRTKCWASLAGAYIKTLVALNRYEEARTLGREMIESAEREKLGYTCCYIEIPLALAEARLGDHGAAVRKSEAVIDSFTSMGSTGLNLGYAYEYRARVAIIMNDEESFRKYALLCAEQYQVGQHPALTAKYEKLMQDARNAGLGVASDNKAGVERDDKDYVMQPQLIDISRSISDYRNSGQRAEFALELLMKHCNAISGYLFGLQGEGLKCLAGKEVEQVPEELQKMVNDYIQAEMEESLTVTMTVVDENAAVGQELKITLSDGRTFEPVLLYSLDHNRSFVVGLAALVPANGELRVADPEFISAISDALLDTGDVVSSYAAA